MTSIGNTASANTLACNMLIADEILNINTSQSINLTNNNEVRWTLGLNENNDFVVQNEVAGVSASIVASNDTGMVTILGGSTGATELEQLTDVSINNPQIDGSIMYYDVSTNKYVFTETSTDLFDPSLPQFIGISNGLYGKHFQSNNLDSYRIWSKNSILEFLQIIIQIQLIIT